MPFFAITTTALDRSGPVAFQCRGKNARVRTLPFLRNDAHGFKTLSFCRFAASGLAGSASSIIYGVSRTNCRTRLRWNSIFREAEVTAAVHDVLSGRRVTTLLDDAVRRAGRPHDPVEWSRRQRAPASRPGRVSIGSRRGRLSGRGWWSEPDRHEEQFGCTLDTAFAGDDEGAHSLIPHSSFPRSSTPSARRLEFRDWSPLPCLRSNRARLNQSEIVMRSFATEQWRTRPCNESSEDAGAAIFLLGVPLDFPLGRPVDPGPVRLVFTPPYAPRITSSQYRTISSSFIFRALLAEMILMLSPLIV